MNVTVDPNEDSEWNDILRKHGIIPERPPDPELIIQEALTNAAQKAHENRLEDKDLDELHELEDEEDEEFLEQYRKKRLAELTSHQKTSIYNTVYPLQKLDYAREVTEASNQSFVLVNLASPQGSGNIESRILSEHWKQLAAKFGDIKFCEIRADLCIEGYPERNTPTILVYRSGEILKQLVTLKELNGRKTKIEDIELVLVELGALKENDSRLKKKSDSADQGSHEDSNDESYDWD